MSIYRIRLDIEIQGPVLSQASGGRDIGLDTVPLVDDAGRPALPGSLIRGNLRDAWSRLHRRLDAAGKHAESWHPDQWLGKPSENSENSQDEGNTPWRARLHFSDLWLADPHPIPAPNRHRIRIAPDTATVERGMLQVIGIPFGTGWTPSFSGIIETELANRAEADELAMRIRKGMEFAGLLGSMKGTGFGIIQCVDTDVSVVPPHRPLNLSPAATRIPLTLAIDRPFCIARPHAGNNRFESEDHIPGGVIRGAMANALFQSDRKTTPRDPAMADLCRHFKHLRVTHAVPVAEGDLRMPVVWPLSLVQARAGNEPDAELELYDVALMAEDAGIIHGQAPAFRIDWKRGCPAARRAAVLCGGALPERRIRVRTAIDPGTGRADTGRLFSTETVVPDGHRWLAEIDLSDVPNADRAAVIQQLDQRLASGLRPIGKTDAAATIDVPPQAPELAAAERNLLEDGIACVCLQSDAHLLPDPYGLPGCGSAPKLRSRYAETWRALSGGTLELVRYFARQRLVGGGYLHRRFWHGEPYNPELLTCAGSVFVLRAVRDPKAATQVLTNWRAQGLGPPSGARGGEDWRRNPFIRHNGYGRVVINLDLHWTLKPSAEAWHGLK